MLHVSAHIAADKSVKAHDASKSGAAPGTPMRTMAEQVTELKRRQKEKTELAERKTREAARCAPSAGLQALVGSCKLILREAGARPA